MTETDTIRATARIPPDLLERATERAREIGTQEDVPISGVVRLALALLAGFTAQEALRQLSSRPSGPKPASQKQS